MKRRLIKVAVVSTGCIVFIAAVVVPVLIPSLKELSPFLNLLLILGITGMATLGVYIVAKSGELRI
ncbi:hypothetical protein ES708_33082 [subsurface metagenome]